MWHCFCFLTSKALRPNFVSLICVSQLVTLKVVSSEQRTTTHWRATRAVTILKFVEPALQERWSPRRTYIRSPQTTSSQNCWGTSIWLKCTLWTVEQSSQCPERSQLSAACHLKSLCSWRISSYLLKWPQGAGTASHFWQESIWEAANMAPGQSNDRCPAPSRHFWRKTCSGAWSSF